MPNYISWEPLAARLAFPLSLGIWGRPGDRFHITGADREGDRIVLGLEHQEDSALLGTLTIDVRRRMAVHLDTPILGLEYRDIQPAEEYVIEATP